MQVSVADAKNKLPELLRMVEGGEQVVITRHGKAVAHLIMAPVSSKTVRLGEMHDRIKFNPGWDDPIDLDRFLDGDI